MCVKEREGEREIGRGEGRERRREGKSLRGSDYTDSM